MFGSDQGWPCLILFCLQYFRDCQLSTTDPRQQSRPHRCRRVEDRAWRRCKIQPWSVSLMPSQLALGIELTNKILQKVYFRQAVGSNLHSRQTHASVFPSRPILGYQKRWFLPFSRQSFASYRGKGLVQVTDSGRFALRHPMSTSFGMLQPLHK
jgi:hypothetical protein